MILLPDRVWSGGALHSGCAVETDGGRVSAVRPRRPDDAGPAPYLLMHACTDLQVNGGGGVMVNGTPTADGLRRIAAAHRGLGTGWILPTVITDAPEVMEAAAEAAIAAHGAGGILGLHIEGPHIALERKGTHDPRFIRPLDRRTVDVVARLREAGVPVLLTLAPEQADPALLAELAEMGTVLSAGHTIADAAQTRTALDRGVTCFTHLYNAMPPMTSREPGIVGTAICSEAFCGLIADGIHVSWEMARIACAARPVAGRMFLVSDAMATVGGPDHFEIYGQTISVRNGALVNAEGSLAGAHVDMVTSLRNAHQQIGLPLDAVLAMATDTPRAVLGLPPQEIAAGTALDDLICLDAGLALVEMPNA